jgi:3-oxoacyl-[acyl-carrier protein] reductase
VQDRFLEGKTAFLSGSFKNMGAEIALSLAKHGANIIVNDLPGVLGKPELDTLLGRIRGKGVSALAVEGDISSLEELKKIRNKVNKEVGDVSIIVNCAGPFNIDPYLELKPESWDLVMNVNLKAIYLTAQIFVPGMKRKKWGRIINLSAGSSLIRNHGVYGLAKAGVTFLTEELACELGSGTITVNAIAPGQVEESLPDVHKIDPSFGERYLARTPLGRLVTRKDIAEIVLFLCSPAADIVTGLTIRADGGAELPRF